MDSRLFPSPGARRDRAEPRPADAPAKSGAREPGTRRDFLALAVVAAVLAPIGGGGCGGNPNEAAISQGPPGVPSTDPGEPEGYVEPADKPRRAPTK